MDKYKPKYIVVKAVKTKVKASGKQASWDYIEKLDKEVDAIIQMKLASCITKRL